MITTLDDELAIEKKKLNALLEITNSVNRNYQVEELLLQFEKVMRYHIGISKLAYINNCNNWDCILHFGVSDACSEFDRTEMLTITEPTLVSETSLKKFTQFDLVLPVFHQEKPLSYLFIGDIQLGLVQFIQKHIGFVQTIANVVSVAIETKMLSEELMEKRLKENDMKMAVYMQNVLLPDKLPSNQYMDIAATYMAKDIVSGDYYDFIPINDNEYVFCIADVSGKGMPAALLMSNFQATLRANVKYNHLNLTLKQLVIELNNSILLAAKGEKFITFFIGYYKSKERVLRYVNAGHNYPILVSKKEAEFLKTGTTVLGAFEELPHLNVGEVRLEKETIIICYTDGMVEVENEGNIQFQSERLAKVVLNNSDLSMNKMNQTLFNALEEYKGTKPYPDDTAVLSLRIK